MTVHKCENMEAIAKENGWKTTTATKLEKYEETKNVDDIKWILYAMRGEQEKMEVLRVEWTGDLQTGAWYKYGEYELRPARKAPVLKLITGQPDPRKFKREEALLKENLTTEDKLANPNVPWENNDAPAFDILVGVVNKTITWISPILGEEQREFCSGESNLRKAHFKVKTTLAGRRVLEWVSEGRFCACYIENIIDVS